MPALDRPGSATEDRPPDGDLRQQCRERVCWHGEIMAGSDLCACTVVDISPYGARVMTAARVAIELPVVINLGAHGVFHGEIRWHDGGLIGVKFTVSNAVDRLPQTPAAPGSKVYEWRREPRKETACAGRISVSDETLGFRPMVCRVLDLSPSGARLLTLEALPSGTKVTLELTAPDAEGAHAATVVWAIGEVCGLLFDRPDERLLQLAASV